MMIRIGVIARPDKTQAGNDIFQIHEEIRKVIVSYHAVPIILIPTNMKYQEKLTDEEFQTLESFLTICDGFLFQGGDDYYPFDFRIIDYAYRNNVPTLGICLGMQAMSVLFDGTLKDESKDGIEHSQKGVEYVHLVNIEPDSKLYSILKTSPIKVNSRHHQYVSNTNLSVCGIATDQTIEAVERKEKDFFIGVQWHPESMIEYDMVSKRLFTEYFKAVKKNHDKRTVSLHYKGDSYFKKEKENKRL